MKEPDSPQVVTVETAVINLSPEAFHMWAGDFLQAARDYQQPARFSAVPYFLLCRAIELEIKSRLLVTARQPEVKKKYRHKLMKAYYDLPADQRVLDPGEEEVLSRVNELYDVPKKAFEYWNPGSALTGRYAKAPELASLDAIATKLVNAPRH